MRTTITLDDDVAAVLERLRKKEQKSFKQIVNELLRLGILKRTAVEEVSELYSTPVLTTGPCLYPNLDNVGEILAVAEREDYS